MLYRVACGLDPGVSIGMIIVRYPAEWRFNPLDVHILRSSVTTEYTPILDLIEEGEQRADHLGVRLTVVMEDFVGSGPRNPDVTRSIKMCGWIEGLCETRKLELITQTPLQMGPFERIAAQQLANAHIEYSPHLRSALAHVLCYLERRYR